MLMTSLPSSERLFIAKRPPLSRLRLDARLAVLEPQDAATLAVMENLLGWSAYRMEDDDAVAIARAEAALHDVPQPTLRAIIRERMELRTVIVALRRRAAGHGPPGAPWGFGRTRYIAENWSDPAFKLDRALPWLRRLIALMERGDPLRLERYILDITFKHLIRHGGNHQFDIEAVVIYVLKWHIFDRWTKANAEAATRRFSDLSRAALADFPDLTLHGAAG